MESIFLIVFSSTFETASFHTHKKNLDFLFEGTLIFLCSSCWTKFLEHKLTFPSFFMPDFLREEHLHLVLLWLPLALPATSSSLESSSLCQHHWRKVLIFFFFRMTDLTPGAFRFHPVFWQFDVGCYLKYLSLWNLTKFFCFSK
jgi:hypothetical protein